VISVLLPVRAISPNETSGEHWSKRSRRAKAHRDATAWALYKQKKPPLPCWVTLTRIAPKRLDEGDNLAMSMKHVRDGVAEWLGIDDGGVLAQWLYAQRRGEAYQYAVLIEIE